MSEKLRMLDRGYELIWHEDRLEDALIGLGPDFEWVVPGHPEGDVRHGPQAVIEFFSDWREQFDDIAVAWELHELDADRVLAIIDSRGRGKASGAPVEMRFAQLWTWRDGRFVRMVLYYDVGAAQREAGLVGRSPADIVRAGIAAYQRGDIEAIIPSLAEDVVWEEDPEWPDGQTWRGHEGVRASFRERLETTDIAIETEEVIERGPRVLVLMRWTAEGQGSGAVAELRPGVLYEFEGELIKRVRFFLRQEPAREAFEGG
jgi:ketosteroid isomerase-like protein